MDNLIEFYDSSVYTLLAPVFAQQFFPSGNRALALLYTYGIVVGVSFVVRPAASVLLSRRSVTGPFVVGALLCLGSTCATAPGKPAVHHAPRRGPH